MSKILMLRHVCGPNFLENVSWNDCSLDRICFGERTLSESNLQVCDQPKISKISLHMLILTNTWQCLKDILPSRRGLHQLSRPTTRYDLSNIHTEIYYEMKNALLN